MSVTLPLFDDESTSLSGLDLTKRGLQRQPGEILFSQGEAAGSLFYIQQGRAKLTVLAVDGREATLMLLAPEDFAGEETLISLVSLRVATATAISYCNVLEIGRTAMIRGMHESHAFSDLFLAFLLRRNMRIQADLIDQLFNSSEKRLARALLLMAELSNCDDPSPLLPSVTQETLAEMIGTTRPRVNFFMNRFRKLGFIDYKGRIRVNKVRLALVLQD